MSYVLFVWQDPVPNSVMDADRIQVQLGAQRPGQNPRFLALARQLTARFPCLSEPAEADGDDRDHVWSDGPVNGITERAVWGLGVQTAFLADVVPFVAKTATELGLVVYDTQSGQAHLPGDVVLTLPRRQPVDWRQPDTADEPKSKREVDKLLTDTLQVTMLRHGFKPARADGERYFTKAFPGHPYLQEQSLVFDIVGYPGDYKVRTHVSIRPDWTALLGEAFVAANHWVTYCYVEQAVMRQRANTQLPAGRQLRPGDEFPLQTWGDARRLAGETLDVLTTAVLPLLDDCLEIARFDAAVNVLPPAPRPLKVHELDILLAHLAGSPRYDDVVAQARRRATLERFTREERLARIAALDAALRPP